MWVEIMVTALLWLHDDNMNFQLKSLMREQFCVHNNYNLGMFLLEKHQWGPLGSGPSQWFRVMPCLLNIHQAGRARATTPVKSLKGF